MFLFLDRLVSTLSGCWAAWGRAWGKQDIQAQGLCRSNHSCPEKLPPSGRATQHRLRGVPALSRAGRPALRYALWARLLRTVSPSRFVARPILMCATHVDASSRPWRLRTIVPCAVSMPNPSSSGRYSSPLPCLLPKRSGLGAVVRRGRWTMGVVEITLYLPDRSCITRYCGHHKRCSVEESRLRIK